MPKRPTDAQSDSSSLAAADKDAGVTPTQESSPTSRAATLASVRVGKRRIVGICGAAMMGVGMLSAYVAATGVREVLLEGGVHPKPVTLASCIALGGGLFSVVWLLVGLRSVLESIGGRLVFIEINDPTASAPARLQAQWFFFDLSLGRARNLGPTVKVRTKWSLHHGASSVRGVCLEIRGASGRELSLRQFGHEAMHRVKWTLDARAAGTSVQAARAATGGRFDGIPQELVDRFDARHSPDGFRWASSRRKARSDWIAASICILSTFSLFLLARAGTPVALVFITGMLALILSSILAPGQRETVQCPDCNVGTRAIREPFPGMSKVVLWLDESRSMTRIRYECPECKRWWTDAD